MKQQNNTAERKKILFKKHKGFMKTVFEKAEFKEPVVILMRRGRKTEFFENATAGEWPIVHTDGNERTLFLDPQYIRTFDYGDEKFAGYICHEDFPTPLPEDPVMTTEMTGIALEKTLNDIKQWKTKEINAQTNMIKAVGSILVLLIGAYIIFKLIFPDTPGPTAAETAEVAKNTAEVVQNTTAPTVITRPVTII